MKACTCRHPLRRKHTVQAHGPSTNVAFHTVQTSGHTTAVGTFLFLEQIPRTSMGRARLGIRHTARMHSQPGYVSQTLSRITHTDTDTVQVPYWDFGADVVHVEQIHYGVNTKNQNKILLPPLFSIRPISTNAIDLHRLSPFKHWDRTSVRIRHTRNPARPL